MRTQRMQKDGSVVWGPSVVARVPITNSWEVHAEYFGTFTQGLAEDVSRPFF